MERFLAAVSGCWGRGQDACLSNGASAFRVRDREVFLSSNEMRPGEKKRRPDVQWIQGTRGSWWGWGQLAGSSLRILCSASLLRKERVRESAMSPLSGQKY